MQSFQVTGLDAPGPGRGVAQTRPVSLFHSSGVSVSAATPWPAGPRKRDQLRGPTATASVAWLFFVVSLSWAMIGNARLATSAAARQARENRGGQSTGAVIGEHQTRGLAGTEGLYAMRPPLADIGVATTKGEKGTGPYFANGELKCQKHFLTLRDTRSRSRLKGSRPRRICFLSRRLIPEQSGRVNRDRHLLVVNFLVGRSCTGPIGRSVVCIVSARFPNRRARSFWINLCGITGGD